MESNETTDYSNPLAHERQLRPDAEAGRETFRGAERPDAGAQVRALSRLHTLSMFLGCGFDLQVGLQEVVETLVDLHGADRGLLSLHDRASGLLFPAAGFGFTTEALLALGQLAPRLETTAWGAAFISGQRAVIEDTETDLQFEQCRAVARLSGFRAVHSTPVLGRDGGALGVLSAFFDAPRIPSEVERQVADLCAFHAAYTVEGARNRQANVRQT